MLFQRLIHIRLNRLSMLQHVLENLLFDKPAKEVELSHRRHKGLDAACLKHNTLAATEGVEETLAVGIEFPLVMKVNEKVPAARGKGCIHLLGVIRNEIVDESKTDGRDALDDGNELFQSSGHRVEFLKPRDDVVLLALNAILDGGRAALQHRKAFEGGHGRVCQFLALALFRPKDLGRRI